MTAKFHGNPFSIKDGDNHFFLGRVMRSTSTGFRGSDVIAYLAQSMTCTSHLTGTKVLYPFFIPEPGTWIRMHVTQPARPPNAEPCGPPRPHACLGKCLTSTAKRVTTRLPSLRLACRASSTLRRDSFPTGVSYCDEDLGSPYRKSLWRVLGSSPAFFR